MAIRGLMKLVQYLRGKKRYNQMPKIYSDPEKDVDGWFKKDRDSIVACLKQMPSDDLSLYAEPRIRKLYFETYFLISLGLHNASIVMCGVLLEALLKEIIFFRERKDLTDIVSAKNADFGHAIKFCESKGYITDTEAEWLRKIKDEIRNRYLHSNVDAIAKGIGYPAWEIKFKNIEELISKIKKIQSGAMDLGAPKIITGDDLRPISDIAKAQIDEKRSLPLFLEVDNFTREMVRRHFEENIKR